MAYEDELTALNNSLQTAINYQNSQQSLKLAEDDLEFGKEAFNQQMALANQQFDWNQRVANRNYEWQKTQWDYQKQLNQLAMQREDNAFQRARADLEKAGLSPLMLSSGSSAQALNAGVAPQYDVNGVNTAYGTKQDALERRRQQINENRQFRFQQKQANRQLALQSASMALQVEKQTQDLINSIYDNRQKKAQTKLLEGEYEYNSKHGYRNADLQAYLVGLVSSYLDKKNSPKDVVDDAVSIIKKGELSVDSKAYEMIEKAPNEKVKTGLGVYYSALKLYGKKKAYELLPPGLKVWFNIGRNWFQNSTKKNDADSEDLY